MRVQADMAKRAIPSLADSQGSLPNSLSKTPPQFAFTELYVLALLQVLSLWSIAPMWQCLFIAVVTLVKWFVPGLFSPLMRFITTIIAVAWFFLFYRLSFTVDIAAGFLWLAASLKLLEINSAKDLKTFVYVMFYVSAVSMLFEQGIVHVLLQITTIFLGLRALLRLHGGALSGSWGHWKTIGKVVAVGLPVVIVLFLFFPRIGPLWSIPVKASSATTGMSDSMSPGDIAKLANSDARVFRADFSGSRPPQSSLYWRGLVLDRFDGRRWSRHPRSFMYSRQGQYDLGRDYESEQAFYNVLLEPHNQVWLYALEGSSSLSSHVKPRDMGMFELGVEAIQAARYRMAYNSPAFIGGLIPTGHQLEGVGRKQTDARRDLQLPVNTNPKTRAYMAQLRLKFANDEALLAHLLREFRSLPFSYTLTPPLLGDDFVDEFMFESRQGFCAHFAGSLAYMLRLAQIPARVVVGYQGGEYIEEEGYLLVREYDAHAWVEAFIKGVGWVRVDPTAMVAPNRIERNLEEAVASEGSFLRDNPVARFRNNSTVLSWFSLKFDNLNYQWQKWVINYSQAEQYDLFKNVLGEYSLTRVAGVMASVFGLVSLMVIFLSLNGSDRQNLSVAQKKYLRWLSLLAVAGFSRHRGETPREFVNRVSPDLPRFLRKRSIARTEALERDEYEAGRRKK